jgi:hypothetical protein
MAVSSYLHVVKGRLRIKVSEIKRSAPKASQVEAMLRALTGVRCVHANPLTGNVLVLYHADRLTPLAIIAALQDADYLRTPAPVVVPVSLPSRSFMDTLGQAVLHAVTDALLQRAIVALL